MTAQSTSSLQRLDQQFEQLASIETSNHRILNEHIEHLHRLTDETPLYPEASPLTEEERNETSSQLIERTLRNLRAYLANSPSSANRNGIFPADNGRIYLAELRSASANSYPLQ
jgi:hypothetical protein